VKKGIKIKKELKINSTLKQKVVTIVQIVEKGIKNKKGIKKYD
jgi:hypothetical protein